MLLSAILRESPDSRGILKDAPPSADLFFERVPAGGDSYLLKHIIHDWDDEKSLQILRNVRGAMNPDEKMFIAEAVSV